MISVQEYLDSTGRNHVEEWLDGLDRTAQARITLGISRLSDGNTSRLKSVGDGVAELRFDFGPGYRLYCGQVGMEVILLLAGGSKKLQQRDITRAKALWREYKTRRHREDNADEKLG